MLISQLTESVIIMTSLAFKMGSVATGAAGSLCSATEVLIPTFGLVGIRPTFLPSPFPQNSFSGASFFSSISPPLASYRIHLS